MERRTGFGLMLFLILILVFVCAQVQAIAAYQKASSSTQSLVGPLPDHSLPRGFQSYNNPQGSGRLLYTKMSSGNNSARAVMRDSLEALRSYFDGPPQLFSAVSDPQDQAVQ